MPSKTAKIIAIFQLYKHAKSIYTADRPGTYSSNHSGLISDIVDNTICGSGN